MKSTGIVRKLDELGRIVIPKEIRKKLNIKPSDEIEIYIQDGDNIVLKKYYVMNNLLKQLNNISKVISNITKLECLIVDTDTVISCIDKVSNKYFNKKISGELLDILVNRKIFESKDSACINLIEDDKITNYQSQIVYPIISESECLGAIILFSNEKNISIDKYIDVLKLTSSVIFMQNS